MQGTDDPIRNIGADSTAMFDRSGSNPTEHASSEALRAATADPDDDAAEELDDEELDDDAEEEEDDEEDEDEDVEDSAEVENVDSEY